MGFKCEYVGELERELLLQRSRCSELVSKLTQTYQRALRAGRLRTGLRPSMAALENVQLRDRPDAVCGCSTPGARWCAGSLAA